MAIGLAIAVPLFLLIAPVITAFVAMHLSFEEIEREEQEMRLPGSYQPVAKDLALFCQTYGSPFHDAKITEVEKAWLPDSAQKLKCRSCYIGPDYLSLEYGGGFHHFGYNVELDKGASNPTERVWRFSFYSEDKNNDNPIELTTIRTPATATCGDFIRTALGHYGQEVSEFPNVLSIYQRQLLFCMKFARYNDAIQCLETARQNLPGDWWPRFALDLVENKSGNQQNRFERWVGDHASYLSYACLVWLYKLENKPSDAARAGQMMLQFEPKDDPLFTNNFCAWTQDVSVYLYHSGYGDLAADLCRKVQLKLKPSPAQSDLSWLKTFQRLETAFSDGSAAKDSAPERSELTKMIFLTDDLFQSAPEALRELAGER